VDTISDSHKGSGVFYEGVLGDTSVIVKQYRRNRKGREEIEKVSLISGSLHPLCISISHHRR
jgi:hypothetical protein